MLQVRHPWFWQVGEGGAASCSSLHWPQGHLCSTCMSTLFCAVYNCTDWGRGYISTHGDSCTYMCARLHLHTHHPLTRPCICFTHSTTAKAVPALHVLQLHHSQLQFSLCSCIWFQTKPVKQLLPKATPVF